MAVVRGRAALPVLARVFGGIAAVLLLVAVVTAVVRVATVAGDERAEGVVVAFHETGRSLAPIVEFTPAGVAPVRFEGGVGSRPPAYDIGERVGVLYPPARPADALIDSFWSLWLVPALAAMIAIPFTIVAIVMLVAVRVTRRRPPTPLDPNG